MKVVILAGGYGTRISEETDTRPKPMVEIGGKPVLWHIMKIYSHYGFNEFVICLGYKGFFIKEYLLLEYNLSFGYNEKNQYICVDGYNYKTDTAMLKVQLSKGQSVHLDTMAKCINDLVNDGYKEPVISIFEKSLSRYKSYYLQTLDNETLTLITPQIITSSDDILFKGQGVSYTEQLESCLEYIAKYLYY